MAIWETDEGKKLETEREVAQYLIEVIRGEKFYPEALNPKATKAAKEAFIKKCDDVELEHVNQVLRRMYDVGKMHERGLTQNVYETLRAASSSMERLSTAVLALLPEGSVIATPRQ